MALHKPFSVFPGGDPSAFDYVFSVHSRFGAHCAVARVAKGAYVTTDSGVFGNGDPNRVPGRAVRRRQGRAGLKF